MALVAQQDRRVAPPSGGPLELRAAAGMDADVVLERLGSNSSGWGRG